jgi:hypothetical protein
VTWGFLLPPSDLPRHLSHRDRHAAQLEHAQRALRRDVVKWWE